jgi:SulP family sulfate permease
MRRRAAPPAASPDPGRAPRCDADRPLALAVPGAAIAVAGFAESAGISARLAAEDGEPWDCRRELLAHGASNLLVAAVGGLPVSGSLSRTSLTGAPGATSQRAHFVTGLAVLLVLPFGAALLSSLPRTTLGGLVVCAMAPLMPPPPAMRLSAVLELRRSAIVGWATLVASLVCSPRLELGLLCGLLLSAVFGALSPTESTIGDGDPPRLLKKNLQRGCKQAMVSS